MQRGILKRLEELEAQVEVPSLNLAKVSQPKLERLELYFLRLAEAGATPADFGALPKKLQRLVLKSMEFV